MRRPVTLAITAAALVSLAAPLQAKADVWHFVAHYGHNFSACDAKGKADVRNGWAGAYDCRNVGPVLWPNFDLWEA